MHFFAQRVQRSMDQLRWMSLKGNWSASAEKMPESAFDFRLRPLEAVDAGLEGELGAFLRALEKARIDRVSFGRAQATAENGGEAIALLRASNASGEISRERVAVASYMQELSAKSAGAPLAEALLCDALATLSQNAKTGQWAFKCLRGRRAALLQSAGGAEGVLHALRFAALRVEASGKIEERVEKMRDLQKWRGQSSVSGEFWGGVGNTVNKQTMRHSR